MSDKGFLDDFGKPWERTINFSLPYIEGYFEGCGNLYGLEMAVNIRRDVEEMREMIRELEAKVEALEYARVCQSQVPQYDAYEYHELERTVEHKDAVIRSLAEQVVILCAEYEDDIKLIAEYVVDRADGRVVYALASEYNDYQEVNTDDSADSSAE